jgi:hypothetical protein
LNGFPCEEDDLGNCPGKTEASQFSLMPCPTVLCDREVVAKIDDIGTTNPNFTEQIKL